MDMQSSIVPVQHKEAIVKMLTPEELQALRKPFPLELHTVREGFKLWKAEEADIRWFVYLDWWAVRERLDDVFPGEWETPEPKALLVGNTVLAMAGITIRGLTRWYSGAGETTADDAKGAVTDALRRAAAQWGIAEYCYNTDLFVRTKTYKVKQGDKWSSDWKQKEVRADEAYQQFGLWYKKRFDIVRTPTLPPPPTTTGTNANGKSAASKSATNITPDDVSPPAAEPEWPTGGSISELVYRSQQGLGISRNADIMRYLGISDINDLEQWKRFPTRKAAADAILAGYNADIEATAKLPPAQPAGSNNNPFTKDKPTAAPRHEWTTADRAALDAHCATFWDADLLAPLLPDKFFADTDHVAWSGFAAGPQAARAALMAYARQHNLPIIVSEAVHAANHKHTTFSNGLLTVTDFSRTRLRELGATWQEYVEDWSSAGGRYVFDRNGLPDLIVSWEAKTHKNDGHEYLSCTGLKELQTETQ